MNVAMIGVGAISGIYLKNLSELFPGVRLAGICDLIPERAARGVEAIRAEREKGFSVELPKVYSDMYEAFSDTDVDIILNLTRPYEHYEVTKQALLHGKHVYSEKPIAVDMNEAYELVALALEKGLRIGGAPDTFMGAGIQTCRRIIDAGFIGDLVGANCAMICRGHETWHPDPEFYYKRGGGPMLDMGPYYITALVNLLGEARSVTAVTKRTFPVRSITSRPHRGEKITVDVDTYLAGCVEFSNGAVAQVFTTFDAYYTQQSRFEVYGSEGTLVVPDPNLFSGPILLYRPEDQRPRPAVDPALAAEDDLSPYRGYRSMPAMFPYRDNSRGLGLADMCAALESGRAARANSCQQLHVLEIMTAFGRSGAEGRRIDLATRYDRSEPMSGRLIGAEQ